MTATLPRAHVESDATPLPEHAAVLTRWHGLRRIAGIVTLSLAAFSAVILEWPVLAIIVALGAGIAVDASIALSSGRSRVGPTLVADISLTGVGLVIATVPAAAVGVVVAYFVLVTTVLGTTRSAWRIGAYAVAVGIVASIASLFTDTTSDIYVRSAVSGVITVTVFGLLTIAMAREYALARTLGGVTVGRRIEIADAVALASKALVAEDDARALGSALDAIREAMDVSAVFVERNVEDPTLGLAAVVVERSADPATVHPSLDVRSKVPWSAMPGARSHLEGGAPFFYRVEEARGTAADRGGDGGLHVEVNVPITLRDEWIGVIGAADRDPDRLWRTDDLALLRTMADLTAAFWQRIEDARVRDSLIGSLDGRLRYEEAIARASQALLGEHAIDLQPALVAVGSAAGVDELFVTETVVGPDGTPQAVVVGAWLSPGSLARYAVDTSWRYADQPDVQSALQRGEMTKRRARHDVSELIAGVEVAGAWHGSVGFVVSGGDHVWRNRDEAFLRTFADIIGAFHERAQNRARLEASLASKDQLIASVSHELRSPLTVVGGLAEELRTAGDRLGDEERDELLAVIATESSEMADLVEDLLVAARSDDGALPVFPESIDLALMTRTVVDRLSIPDTHTVKVADAAPVALADPVRVRQVIRNLLTNAFRYGGRNVTATFGCSDTMAWIDIHDDGAGVPEEDRARVFEAYGRSRSATQLRSSVGLGLSLSRRLAHLMGGELSYVDGPGCTFRFEVPLPKADS
ncbi:MAG TPA: GAF domain-containing sensor histidine kinase [Acidimicrobiia bacterium]|nr:GAF domain-containing sensor histidine kinase [Acidimicrobiia bacterium]